MSQIALLYPFVNYSGQLASTSGADGLVSISPVDYSLSSATCKLTEWVGFISRWKARQIKQTGNPDLTLRCRKFYLEFKNMAKTGRFD